MPVAQDAFCRRAISRQRFLTSEYAMALYDIAPVVPGHVLIVPIRHVENVYDLTVDESNDIMDMMRKVLPVLLRVYGDGSGSYDIMAQVGPSSNRTVSHIHFHVMPRRKDDQYNKKGADIFRKATQVRITPAELKKQVSRLRKEFEDVA